MIGSLDHQSNVAGDRSVLLAAHSFGVYFWIGLLIYVSDANFMLRLGARVVI